jgi:cullin 1
MLVEVNIHNLDIYHREFESDLLVQTRQYYAAESQTFIAANSVPDYLRKAEARLLEEEARADRYFDKSTKPKLRHILQDELIVKYASRLVRDPSSGAAHLLTTGAVDDMARMYSLFCRQPTTLVELRECLSSLVKSSGTSIVNDREHARQPRLFVDKVLECRSHFLRFVDLSFKQDRNFARVLKEALEYFINLDTRAAHYLALYTDDLLRKQQAQHSAGLSDQVRTADGHFAPSDANRTSKWNGAGC